MPTLVVAIVLLISLVTSCMQFDRKTNEPRISNESGAAVEVFWSTPGGEDLYDADIPPGSVIGIYEWPASCAPRNMVARTTDGLALDRTDKPLCPGNFWIIGLPGAPSPS